MLICPELPFNQLYKRALSVFMLCILFCLYRILRGPTAPDRIVTIDIFGILIVGLCAILSIPTGRTWYIDIGIAWALQSFIGTLALAKYLEGKGFDE
ncbi:MAG: cation:proton antiporter [Candidatus Omnitrophica bacterium]|nr:cation:proton antiporter [Candidatus Omnitrophota bacterium]